MGLCAYFKKRRRRQIISRFSVPDGPWTRVRRQLPVIDHLDPGRTDRLKTLTTVLAYEKTFLPLGGITIDEAMRVTVAALAALPVLELGLDWLDDFTTISLTPQAFPDPVPRREGPLVTEYSGPLGGEVSVYGSIILSWPDVLRSGQGRGYNVVVHEIAHILDKSNQSMDGCPYLTPEQDPARWKKVFTAAYTDLRARLYTAPPLDPYAGESPSEFFAVVSEEFFDRPARLAFHYPDVYGELVGFYKWDPRE